MVPFMDFSEIYIRTFINEMASHLMHIVRVVVEEGMAPGPRYGHVMGLSGNKLVIFGGKNGTIYLCIRSTLV